MTEEEDEELESLEQRDDPDGDPLLEEEMKDNTEALRRRFQWRRLKKKPRMTMIDDMRTEDLIMSNTNND